MKRYFAILIIMLGSKAFLYSQDPSTVISFDERIHDFGNILEKNGKVSHTFTFHNKGKTTVAVNDIYSGCGCIGKIASKEPVKPGGKGQVTITFDPGYKSGFFSKEIVVLSNDGRNYNRIWVQGTITPAEHPVKEDYPYDFGQGLYLRLKVMAFGYMKPGETRQMELHYANNTDKEMTLNFVPDVSMPSLKFADPGRIGPKAKGVMRFTFTMPAPGGDDILLPIHPYVNGKKVSNALTIKILSSNKLNR